MWQPTLNLLAEVTGLAVDKLAPYCRAANRLDHNLLQTLPPATMTLDACLALTLVPRSEQRQVMDTLLAKGSPPTAEAINHQISVLHTTLKDTNAPRLLEWLLWMLESMRERPYTQEEAGALFPEMKKLQEAIRLLKEHVEGLNKAGN